MGMEVGETITVVLKNPRALTEENFEVNVAMDMTLGHLKDLIHSDYPGNPCPGSLTLVYAGKVLRDEGLILSEVFPKDGSRVAVHMVIRQMADEPSSSIESHRTRLPDDSVGPSTNGTAEVPRETTVDTPSADTEENPEHLPSGDIPTTDSGGISMYDSVLRASYKAALQVIVEEGLEVSAQQNFTFIPAIIPVPRGNIHNRDEEQHINHYMVPMVPMTYAFPRALVDRQEHVVRRRDAREENVRALFRAIRHGGDDNNIQRIPRRNNQNNNNNNNGRQIQIRIHLNVRMLLQVAVLSFILYQHCPPSRFVGMSLLGLLFYFSTTRFGRMLLRRLTGHFNMHPPEPNQQVRERVADENPEPPLPRDGAEADIEREQRRPGLLREIQSFITGFFASILPAADQPRNGNNAAVVQDVFRGQ